MPRVRHALGRHGGFVLAVFRHLVQAHELVALFDQGRHHLAHQFGRLDMDAVHQQNPTILAARLAQIALGAGAGGPFQVPAIPISGAHHIAGAVEGDVAADIPIDRADIFAQLRIGIQDGGMGMLPGAIGRAEIGFVAGRHQRRNLVIHIAELVQQPVGIGVIAGAQKGMGGAVIGQQMAFAGDTRQHLRIAVRLVADDEEGRLDVHLLQRVQHLAGMGVGAVIEGQRNGVAMHDAGMEDGLFLEQRQLVAGARGCRQSQHQAQSARNFPHDHPRERPKPDLINRAGVTGARRHWPEKGIIP